MPKRNFYSGEYQISKHAFLAAVHYGLQYKDWLREYKTLLNGIKAIDYTSDRVKSSQSTDLTYKLVSRRIELLGKMRKVEEAAQEADPFYMKWLLKMATIEDCTYALLKNPADKDIPPIPCERTKFYELRRKFYYLLSKKI